jgi:hypothetical protein
MGICGSLDNSEDAQSNHNHNNQPSQRPQQVSRAPSIQIQQQQVSQQRTAQRVPWDYEYRTWTDEQLQQHRKIWWETRVTNLPEVWQAIRLYVGTTDEAARKSIIAAAGITPFQVDEKQNTVYCYDRKGAQYDIPYVILKNPTRISDSAGQATEKQKDAAEIQREQSKVSVKLRLSNGTDVKVETMGSETIGGLKKRIFDDYKIAPERQRMLYQGTLFTDNTTTLARAGIKQTNPITVLQIFLIPPDVPLTQYKR